MNNNIIINIIITFCFTGCTVSQRTARLDQTEAGIALNCSDHNLPTTYFSGKVTETNSRQAIPLANILLRSLDRTVQYGAVTDEEGKFIFKDIPLGVYSINVTGVGYEAEEIGEWELKRYSNCVADVQLDFIQKMIEKPIIYLYPSQKQMVQVRINYLGTLTHTYPSYPEHGWKVIAEPDGTLWDENNQEYYALFWEGTPAHQIVPDDGFVVPGNETAAFLEEKLAYLGLSRREANEFIMYWLPRMEGNSYNFIHFAGKPYEELAALDVFPEPETIIRVMMLTKPLERKMNIPLQDLTSLKKSRKGFTLVEWGGCEIDVIKENSTDLYHKYR